jgi:hypothetical protein
MVTLRYLRVRHKARDFRKCADPMRRTKARRNVRSLSFVQTLRSKEATKWTRHRALRFLRTLFTARQALKGEARQPASDFFNRCTLGILIQRFASSAARNAGSCLWLPMMIAARVTSGRSP